VCALVAAVPTTIVYKAPTGEAPAATLVPRPRATLAPGSSYYDVMKMVYTFNGALLVSIPDAILTGLWATAPYQLHYFLAGSLAAQQAAAFPGNISDPSEEDAASIWVYHNVPIVIHVFVAKAKSDGKSVSPLYAGLYGVFNAIWFAGGNLPGVRLHAVEMLLTVVESAGQDILGASHALRRPLGQRG
jgi:hypothetical protein